MLLTQISFDGSLVLNQKGVGQLIKMATEKGRAANPNLMVSSEHGSHYIIVFMW
ncbi:putative pyruvate, phosphate dikinase [Helianthus anomalus]